MIDYVINISGQNTKHNLRKTFINTLHIRTTVKISTDKKGEHFFIYKKIWHIKIKSGNVGTD